MNQLKRCKVCSKRKDNVACLYADCPRNRPGGLMIWISVAILVVAVFGTWLAAKFFAS